MTKNFAHLTSGLALTAAGVLLFSAMSAAQSLPNYTNFPVIGLVRGQTLQINIVAYPPDPCFATLGFQDINGIRWARRPPSSCRRGNRHR